LFIIVNDFIFRVFTKKCCIEHPKNIILLIGDGMGAAQVYAGIVANKGHLNIERSQFIGFHKNQATDDFVTDSGAGATALSIGQKSYNGSIGVDSLKKHNQQF